MSSLHPHSKESMQQARLEGIKKEKAMSIAFGEGAKYGIGGLIAGTLGSLAALKYSPWYNKYMGPSAKTSIPLMLGVFLWAVKYELVVVDAQRNPELYGLSNDHVEKGKVIRMPFHHRFMNYMHDHPFVMVTSLGTPLAVAVAYTQSKHTHLSLSKKIMASRVFIQGGVITILLATMGFKEYMDKNGRFPEPDE